MSINLNRYRNMIEAVNPNAILTPFISNHDMDRAAGYLSLTDYEMQMAANLYLLTYGNPFIYYGEEIGMKGSRSTEMTDANRRLAMLWGDGDTVKDPIVRLMTP
jgi:glycosidase